MFITKDIQYIGVNDHKVDLFEGQYVVPNGMAYNSYVILDEKIAVMDTVDANFTHEWLDNLHCAAHGAGSLCEYHELCEGVSGCNFGGFRKGFPDDEEFLRHRVHR